MSQENKDRATPTPPPATPDPQGAVEATERTDEALLALQQELEQTRAKADENWSLYLSARADMENMRKRMERELSNAHKFALEKFLNELLPVKDSLELGIQAAGESHEATDVVKLREGSELTLRMLVAAIEKQGVQELNPLGDKFNPTLHEAIAMQPTADAEPNTVLHVMQKGYVLNERLLRPARVIVAKAAPTSGD